jgi:K+-sensing histidine kinase KdpD
LYLSRAVIEAHNGTIWADPRHEAGARMCFSLPRPEGVPSNKNLL